MNKKKYLSLFFVLIISLFVLNNVEAVSYGYKTCNGNQRWSPSNPCDGDDAVEHPDAFSINFDSNHNVTGVGTDLFNKGSINWLPDSKRANVYYYTNTSFNSTKQWIDTVENFGLNCGNIQGQLVHAKSCIEAGSAIVYSILHKQEIYHHDYREIVKYYQINGVYPKLIVAEKIGYEVKFADMYSLTEYYYVYRPSDWLTYDDATISATIVSPIATITNIKNNIDNMNLGEWSNVIGDAFALILMPSGMNILAASNTLFTDREVYYFSTDLSSNTIINSCDDIDSELDLLGQIKAEKGTSSDEYIKQETFLKEKCNDYKTKHSKTPNSACYQKCIQIDQLIRDVDTSNYKTTNECGIGQDMVGWLIRILKIVRYIAPILVIVLSIVDYIGAISSAEDDAMKKAGSRFSKRLLVLIVFFLLPSLIQLILNIFNVDGLSNTNPYCLK